MKPQRPVKKKIRILLADDHDIVRRGIRPLIESEWGWEICGEAVEGRQAVTMALELKPDIVIVDVSMPELGGVEVTRQIKRDLPGTEVLIFSGQENEALVHQLFAAGARGFVLKSEAAANLIPAIKALCHHQPFFGAHVSGIVFDQYLKGGRSPEQAAPDGLTPREREIVQLLAEGKSNKDVATTLGISVKTAETHRAAVMRKLGFGAFSELVRYAVRNHIVQP
jgi:DNA-binding NarL/FixJ family response regulator